MIKKIEKEKYATDLELLAGVPNDDNREYIPMKIKGTDMTVNENGNNAQVYPKRLVESHGTLGGITGEWLEYVPESYDGSHPVPLVVGNYGGNFERHSAINTLYRNPYILVVT